MQLGNQRGEVAKLLYPGMRIKRWLVLFLSGLILMIFGFAYILLELFRSAELPAVVDGLVSWPLPHSVLAVFFSAVGALLCMVGLRGLYRSLAEVVVPARNGQAGLLDMIYEARLRRSGPKVVCIGGGTGMPTVLRGLKEFTTNITAIVTVGDDGGSSGRLRREHGILPPGDFRNSIVALAEVEPLMERLFQYRFGGGSTLEGHSFGNLFVLAMTGVTGNFEQAIRETSRVLAVKGTILPSTLDDVAIGACFADGTEVVGESQIPEVRKPISRIFLRPAHPVAQPEAVKAILEADLVVLGPGSLFTSVVPNLLVEGIAKAVGQTEATRVYVCNLATQPGETDQFDVGAHVAALMEYLPTDRPALDCVLANGRPLEPSALVPDVDTVGIPSSAQRIAGARLVLEDVVREDFPLRHDPQKLARVLFKIYSEHPHRPNQ